MKKLTNRMLGTLATSAVAVAIACTGAPAAHAEQQAPTARPALSVQPFTAHKCGSVYCVNVYGSGLHVDYETVARANNGAMSGYVNAQDDDDSWHKASGYFAVTSGLTRLNIDHSFSNNSTFCGGVKSTPDWQDYKDMVCVTIHS
ncbi:hypothetical protein [Actinacidiphila epipremni]|jgi:hypothetical protein|uniref:Secreted protein n=1 Tax=Actinacidiphila epipremni TaxID=2053013 RepID=A0ABX0ZM41_9ACTN|nr:hypothetical protein [Actinacidiphila epipremni]NJP42706.1 hypothetical protein [Actinacidiphila epipremni]